MVLEGLRWRQGTKVVAECPGNIPRTGAPEAPGNGEESASTGQNGPFSTPSLSLVFLFLAPPPNEPRGVPAPFSSGQSPQRSLGATLGSGLWSICILKGQQRWGVGYSSGSPGHQAEWPQLSPSWRPAVTVPWQLLNTSSITHPPPPSRPC